eukprot:CAMPEP_0194291294 /NCGR_PEP_ID=MMETSP0169-20130528/43144_1 /TAXON_ID=218684 /ORGANISM="Corethron pennatum, Strain L29A3" /LENGTH=235 /DNA_ID=CAMNT_0039039129 /DNA_START=133 /DNA_END=837 /DNA_ORIENTATION=+
MTAFYKATVAFKTSETTEKNDVAPQRILKNGTGHDKEEAILTPAMVDDETSDDAISYFDLHNGGGTNPAPIENCDDYGDGALPDADISFQKNSSKTTKKKLIIRRRKQIISAAQSLIVELRHAAKCRSHETTGSVRSHNCPDPIRCRENKHLFRHILGCTKGRDCGVARCASSKRVLQHYHACVDKRCPLCVPLRTAIRQNAKLKAHNRDFSGERAREAPLFCAGKNKLLQGFVE